METVDRLPILTAGEMGELLRVPEGHAYLAVQTVWESAPIEVVASALMTACTRAGQWGAVVEGALYKVLEEYAVYQLETDNCLRALGSLIRDEKIKFIQFGNQRYFVPTRMLVDEVRAASFRFLPESARV